MCQHRFQANSIRKMDADLKESPTMEMEKSPVNTRVIKSASIPGRTRKYSLSSRRRTHGATYKTYRMHAKLASFTEDTIVIGTVSSHNSLWFPSASGMSMGTRDRTLLHFHQTGHHDDYASEPENRIK